VGAVSWMNEVLGLRKEQRRAHTELEEIELSRISLVDHAASGYDDAFLLLKAKDAERLQKRASLGGAFRGLASGAVQRIDLG